LPRSFALVSFNFATLISRLRDWPEDSPFFSQLSEQPSADIARDRCPLLTVLTSALASEITDTPYSIRMSATQDLGGTKPDSIKDTIPAGDDARHVLEHDKVSFVSDDQDDGVTQMEALCKSQLSCRPNKS
jgi:hypothetical protein